MARAPLSVEVIALTGLEPTYVAAIADGHMAECVDGNLLISVKNGSGASMDVTCLTPAKIGGLDIAEVVVAIPAAEERTIGPFNPSIFGQVDGRVWIDYSLHTSVTIAAMRLPRG